MAERSSGGGRRHATEAERERVWGEILGFYAPQVDGTYGAGLSQTSHALQCAHQAELAGCGPHTIVAALLHDIGWKLARPRAELGDHAASNVAGLDSIAAEEGILAFCGEQLGGYGAGDTSVSAEQQKAQHDVIGSTWLQMRGFAYAVAHLVEGHVLAKRYLTGTDTGYFDQLEQDSVRTLRFQGGPMDEQEARTFERDLLFEECVQLRRWDEGAKLVGKGDVLGWDHFKPLVMESLLWAPCTAHEFGLHGGLAFVRDGNRIVAPARARLDPPPSTAARL
jgi:predicted HD phosphohydrolase